MVSGAIIFLAGEWFASLFTDDAKVIGIAKDYLFVAAITLPSYVVLFQTVFMLQGLKKPIYALWVGLYRQIVAPCIVFWFLAFLLDWKLWGIWWGIFMVTWSAALFMFWFGRWKLNRVERAAAVAA